MLRTIVGMILFAILAGSVAAAAPYKSPRTPWGAPDLEGLWTNASRTELERPAGLTRLNLPDAEAAAFAAALPAAPSATQGSPVDQAGSEWWDMGSGLARLDGAARTSWIVEPSDGRLPYSAAGLAHLKARQRAGLVGMDGPEDRPAPERCLAGLGGASGPPMLNSSYNNLIRIVQTANFVVIVTEMGGARIAPLEGRPEPPGPNWGGQSRAMWEGDTLIVVTAGFQPGESWRAPSRLYLSRDAVVTERFTRTTKAEIRYAFSVSDPATFTQTWRAEMPLRATPGPMFEFACHEGNYSLSGILAGQRKADHE